MHGAFGEPFGAPVPVGFRVAFICLQIRAVSIALKDVIRRDVHEPLARFRGCARKVGRAGHVYAVTGATRVAVLALGTADVGIGGEVDDGFGACPGNGRVNGSLVGDVDCKLLPGEVST